MGKNLQAAAILLISIFILRSSTAQADYQSEFKRRETLSVKNHLKNLKQKAIADVLHQIEKESGQRIVSYQLKVDEVGGYPGMQYGVFVRVYARMEDGKICSSVYAGVTCH